MDEVSLAIAAIELEKNHVSATFRQELLESNFNEETSAAAQFSPRELEVIRLYASGLSVTHIAKKLARSAKTISQQKADSTLELDLKNDRDIYIHAEEHSLVS